MDDTPISEPPDEKGDLPDLIEAQTSHEAAMAAWNKNWAYFYALTLVPDGMSLSDAILACGARPLNPDLTFDQIVSTWDETLVGQIGPQPQMSMYPDVDIELHNFRARGRQYAFQRRPTVQNKVPSLTPASRANEITEPPPEGATRDIIPQEKPRETLPSGATRDRRPNNAPISIVAPPPSTGKVGPQGASTVSATLVGYQPAVPPPVGSEADISFEELLMEDDATAPDESWAETRSFFDVSGNESGDTTLVKPLEEVTDLPAVRGQDALRERGLAAHAEYTAQEGLANARISYPPSTPNLMLPPPAGDTSSPSGRRLLNLEERSVTDAVAAVVMPGSGYSGEAQGFNPRASMIRRGGPPDAAEDDDELASLGPTTADRMPSKVPAAIEDLKRFERAQEEARRKLMPSGRTTLEGMAPASVQATEVPPVAPRVSRPPATPQPVARVRPATPKPPASDEDPRQLSVQDLAQATTLPPPIVEPPLRGLGPITGNQGYQLTPPRGVKKTIVRPLPTKTIGLVLGGVLLVAALFAGVITKLQYTPPVSTASLAETTRSVPAAAPTPPPPAAKVCLAQAAFDQLTLAEQNSYFGCKSRRDEAPLFRCQISAAETREARLPFCRLVRDTCRILPGVAVTSAQAACLADPIGHAAPAPSR